MTPPKVSWGENPFPEGHLDGCTCHWCQATSEISKGYQNPDCLDSNEDFEADYD